MLCSIFSSHSIVACPSSGLFDVVEGRAAQLAASTQQQADAQRALAGELGALADSSAGIRSAVDVVIMYQQRSASGWSRMGGGCLGHVGVCASET